MDNTSARRFAEPLLRKWEKEIDALSQQDPWSYGQGRADGLLECVSDMARLLYPIEQWPDCMADEVREYLQEQEADSYLSSPENY